MSEPKPLYHDGMGIFFDEATDGMGHLAAALALVDYEPAHINNVRQAVRELALYLRELALYLREEGR